MSPEARIKALRDASPGSWVAFSQDESRVVAYGKTYDEAVAAAEEKGESDPVITRVPTDWAAPSIRLLYGLRLPEEERPQGCI